jgi:dTDP-4-dehydrorhamnose reductase
VCIARACATVGSRFVTFSTDYVFDGTKSGGYVESDDTAPINVYGSTKREGEVLALEADPHALVVRTSWVMSGTHRSFASVMLDLIGRGDVTVIEDQRGRPRSSTISPAPPWPRSTPTRTASFT